MSDLVFPLSKLLDPNNSPQVKMFSRFSSDVWKRPESPFSHENTYNGLMVECLYKDKCDDGIWDASAEVDLEKGLLVVSGHEYPGGGGAYITVWFDVTGELVDYTIKIQKGTAHSRPDIQALVESLQTHQLKVEPRDKKAADRIKYFLAGIYEEV